MTDLPKTPETAPDPTTDATPAAAAATAAAAPRPESVLADTARLLAEHFPALFGAGVIKPIKLRIQADIHQRVPGVFTRKALSLFLHRHTTGTAYLRALVAEAATRIDLDGQPAGEIAAEHREAAAAELERRRVIVEARKQAARDAARAARRDARPPRPSHEAQASQSSSPRSGVRPAPRGAGAVRPAAAGRTDRAPRPSEHRRPPGRPPEPRPERKRAPAHEQEPANAPSRPSTPEEAAETEARRQRAMLLRSFEQSPLSKANFGALKGLSEEALDALLTLARQERGSR